MYKVLIIEHSVADGCRPLITVQARYPRFIHSEFMTHRMFSRNASSSRAIPVKKMLAQVWKDPVEPVHWGQNQAGMQAAAELTGWKKVAARTLWRTAAKAACGFVWMIDKLGGHKQWSNRILEPWMYITVIMTATEWENFFLLRDHKDAQPEFRALAKDIRWAVSQSKPTVRRGTAAQESAWHLPYVSEFERMTHDLADLLKMSAARCARVSYLTHDRERPTLEDDSKLFMRLVGSTPRHSSPIEHQACLQSGVKSNNFTDWWQFREMYEETTEGAKL